MKHRDWAELLQTLGHDPSMPLDAILAPPQMPATVSETFDFAFAGEDLEAGPARELLQKMISAMGLTLSRVRILDMTNLAQSLLEIRPRWLVALGTVPAQFLLQSDQKLELLRGHIHTTPRWFRDGEGQDLIKIIPTYHPVFLLRNPDLKKACWDDLQMVMRDAGLGS